MKILAIETSCDETAVALAEAKGGLRNPCFKILKSLVASQIKIHQPFGGVVPNLAKREHIRNLPILSNQLIKANSFNLIAVTVGPGLEPCLWAGINFTKELYRELKIKNKELRIIDVSHLEGHLYSFLLGFKSQSYEAWSRKIKFPAVALIVSGGHTILLLMRDLTHYKKLGETRDDAVGESFDKVARLLGLPYPGGPEIEKLAKHGRPTSINFPRPMINQKNYDFSFSGLKTAVLYYLRDNKNVKIEDVAASFQLAAFDVLIDKTLKAVKEFRARSVMISGGVASNFSLRKNLKFKIKKSKLKINVLIPPKKICLDNAAIIAVAGYLNYLKNKRHRLVAQGNLSLS